VRFGSGLRVVLPVLFALVVATLARADGGPNHQTRNLHFGVSGGNVNDRTRNSCCSGTLGSLLTDGAGNQYILSNNHVLARRDQAAAGEDISQPGLIDNNCRVGTIAADFRAAPPLESNVDAAVATLRPGTMDPTGFIEDIGTISSTIRSPGVGLAVAKSGRATGFTSGSIAAINTTVSVRYQMRCGQGRKFTATFTNHVVVTGASFSAGGDSGSLIVTNDSAHQPVALLFAGSSTTTIANPVGEVLTKLSDVMGTGVEFVGSPVQGSLSSSVPEEDVTLATRVKNAHAPRFLADPQVFAVGVGADPDEAGKAAVVLYVEHGRGRADIPDRLDGFATVVVETDPITAYGWNMPRRLRCRAAS
jgi:hypothetical protein